jgi:hypothetical protein
MELEVGYGLVSLVDTSQGGDLLDRISAVRRQLAAELGLVMPPVRIRDNIQLEGSQYRVKIRGNAGRVRIRQARQASGDGLGDCLGPHPGRTHAGTGVRPGRVVDRPLAAHPRRDDELHRRRSLQRAGDSPHGDRQETRRRAAHARGGRQSPRAAQGQEPQARGGDGPRGAQARGASEGPPGAPPRAGSDPRSGDHPGDPGRLGHQDQGPGRAGGIRAQRPAPVDLRSVRRSEARRRPSIWSA